MSNPSAVSRSIAWKANLNMVALHAFAPLKASLSDEQTGVTKKMTRNVKTSPADLLANIKTFERLLLEKVRNARLSGKLIDEASVRANIRSGDDSATINFTFKAGEGMDHVLSTIVDGEIVGTPERRGELADNFVLHMQRAVIRAAEGAASRRAIALAAAKVISEAQAEGLDLELLQVEPAPISVFGKPRVEDENAQVFYVHVVLPHLDGGMLTRDSYTIDADDAEEFADYLRHRTLPELRELVRLSKALEATP
jgi:hypothetical protein